jgi:hypothetical protein
MLKQGSFPLHRFSIEIPESGLNSGSSYRTPIFPAYSALDLVKLINCDHDASEMDFAKL